MNYRRSLIGNAVIANTKKGISFGFNMTAEIMDMDGFYLM